MANHKSAIKRIRANKAKRTLNRYQHKTVRTALKALKSEKDKKTVQEQLPSIFSMIDKLSKKNIIHKNKASNLKSKVAKAAAKL